MGATDVTAPWEVTGTRPGPPAFPQVEVPGAGVLSLATLDELRGARDSARANADHLARQAAELDEGAEDGLAEAGALLVTRQGGWDVPPDLAPLVLRAERLVARIAGLDDRMAALEGGGRPARTAGGLASTVRGWWGGMLRRLREHSAARLRSTLLQLAGTGMGVDVPGVEPLLDHAVELRARADGLRRALA